MANSITPINTVINRVNTWARTNLPEHYMNSSRMVYFRQAFTAGIITKDELEDARLYYGRLWDYTGD
jgi:hypothetical protein